MRNAGDPSELKPRRRLWAGRTARVESIVQLKCAKALLTSVVGKATLGPEQPGSFRQLQDRSRGHWVRGGAKGLCDGPVGIKVHLPVMLIVAVGPHA